ncbi:MAG: sugar ABC transporter substrate-binding protein [Dorea sp.]|nr:sugar ABC transporter substrate-binding protein [Dorea sp.]
MKMKKLVSMLLILIMTLSLAACGSSSGSSDSSDDSSDDSAEGGKYRVAFVARASADTFAAWLTREMISEAEQYDEIELDYFSGEADDNKLNGILEDCITKDYDLVIVQVNDNVASAPYIKQVVDAGIPVITTNPAVHQGDLDGTDDDSLLEGTGTVDADPIEQAAVSARYAVEEVPENANVVVLMGPSNNFHSDGRREGWQTEFFDKRPDVNILYEDYANWNSDEALALMETWVQGGTKIDAIISMNDNMAAGAIEAIRNNSDYFDADGNPTFLAYGVDGNAQGCLLVQEGLLTRTSLQDASLLAEQCIANAVKVLNGEMDVTEVEYYVDAPEINIDTVQQYIDLYKENGEISDDGSLVE